MPDVLNQPAIGARRPRRPRTVPVLIAVGTVALAVLVMAVSTRGSGPPWWSTVFDDNVSGVVRIAPAATGQGAGDSWSEAAPLSALPVLLSKASPGTEFWLLADAGPYRLSGPMELTNGGTRGEPVVVRGVDRDGGPMAAELVGTRSEPYSPDGEPGKEAFRLLAGADHLVFQDLGFRNIGNGCFRVGSDVAGLTIRRVTATNVRRFIENHVSGDEETATISGLTVSDVTATGFSRAFARIQYDSHDLLFEDVSGDSEGQDGDPFAQGIQLAGTTHGAVFRDVSMINAVSTFGEYWNGDGFSAEKETYDLRFERTYAAGNTDAGYDLKSRSTTLVDATASDNKRNFRFWGEITVESCVGEEPRKRGGTGTQAQVHATREAVVALRDCEFSDSDSETIVFDVDGHAFLDVTSTTVVHAPEGRLETVESNADLMKSSVSVN